MGCCAQKDSDANKLVIMQPPNQPGNTNKVIKRLPSNNEPKYIPDEADDINNNNNNNTTEPQLNSISIKSNPLNPSYPQPVQSFSSDPPAIQSIHAVQSTDDFTNALDYALVKSWLENTVCLPQYYPVFITNGYETMEQIYTITDKKQLTSIGITLKGHITKLMADINRGRPNPLLHAQEIQTANNNIHGNVYNNNNNKMEMKYNNNNNNNNNDIDIQCNGKGIENCPSIHRVLQYMKIYENWNSEQDALGELKWEAFTQQLISYEITQLLNDFHHYQSDHNNPYNLLFVSTTLLESINNLKCHKTHEIENHIQAVNDKNANLSTEDLLKLQLLDQIHSQFMHNNTGSSYSNNGSMSTKQSNIKVTAMDHTADDIDAPIYDNNTNGKDEQNNNLIPIKLAPIKTPNLSSEQHKKHVRQCSKFCTQLLQNSGPNHAVGRSSGQYSFGNSNSMSFDSDTDEDENENKDIIVLPSYGFGKRWYYWKHYKLIKHKDYITAQWNDLKQELLCNSIYTIDNCDWISAYSKANLYMKCGKAKRLYASGNLMNYYYGHTNGGEKIRIEHIIALLFYCNYDMLQAKFSESFRIIATDHKNINNNIRFNLWDRVKNRNKQYANWARLLRECVELYGIAMRQCENIKLYHGLNCELVFDSINCKFCAPTSMTTSRAIAESFSKGFGLILTLRMYDDDLRFFDCNWLSDYPSEEEKLFIGGSNFIKLNSIILSRLGHNYKHYICAIGIIQNMFDARHNPEKDGKMDHKTMNAVNNLLQSRISQWDEINAYNDEIMNDTNELNDNDPHIFMTSTKSLPYVIPQENKNNNEDVLGPMPSFPVDMTGKYGHRKSLTASSKPKDYMFKHIVEIPTYVAQLFEHFCKNWDKTIQIDITKFNNRSDYKNFKDLIIESVNDKYMTKHEISYPIKIDVICKIFENINCIEIVNGFIFTQYTFNYLFKLLIKNENSVFKNLNQIKIGNSSQSDERVQTLVNLRSRDFAKNNWDIAYDYIDQTLETIKSIQQSKYVVLVKNVNDTLR